MESGDKYTLDWKTNWSQITWICPGFKTKSPFLGKPGWFVTLTLDLCILPHTCYSSIFINLEKKNINREKCLQWLSFALRTKSNSSLHMQLLQFGPYVSLHFLIWPHSLWPLCDHTADSSLNMPHSLTLQLVPLPRHLFP